MLALDAWRRSGPLGRQDDSLGAPLSSFAYHSATDRDQEQAMSLSFHDPRGITRVAAEAYTCRATLDGTPTIGLLANNFPDSVEFLDAIERALAVALPTARFQRYLKPNASVPAKNALIERIATECDALVTAYGH